MRIDTLPSQYKPFKEINVGTNYHIYGEILFSINDNVPLLIGVGDIPRIWLSIPADPNGENWQPLVRDNKSLHPKVKVRKEGSSIIIDTPDGVVLHVNKENESKATILFIDFRPFGINIHSNESSLTVMNSHLEKNVFNNVEVMVNIGKKNKIPNHAFNYPRVAR